MTPPTTPQITVRIRPQRIDFGADEVPMPTELHGARSNFRMMTARAMTKTHMSDSLQSAADKVVVPKSDAAIQRAAGSPKSAMSKPIHVSGLFFTGHAEGFSISVEG